MALITEIRKNVTEATPLMAMVGATDLAAERVREVAADAGHLQEEFEKAVAQWETKPSQWWTKLREVEFATVQQAPVLAVHRVMEWAQDVEQSYQELAEHGRDVVERARQAAPTQDLLKQGKTTLGRVKAAVTSVRRTVAETASAAKDVLVIGRREAGEVVGAVEAEVAEGVATTEQVVAEHTRGTRAAVHDAAALVRRRAASTRTAARTATTSVRKTAEKAVVAVEGLAGHIGEEPVAEVAEVVQDAESGPASVE